MMYKRDGKVYTTIVEEGVNLSLFCYDGHIEDMTHNGVAVKATFRFEYDGEEPSQYAGPIVIFFDEEGEFWIAPKFQFLDGRYEKVEV